MICALCNSAIKQDDEVNLHHPIPRSKGGTETAPTHKECHVAHHSDSGDFRVWGKQGGLITATTKRWSFNLRNVKQHPAYNIACSFYTANYAH